MRYLSELDGALVKSACAQSHPTWGGARSLEEFHDKAVVGVQSTSGYDEGMPLATSW